MPVGVDIGTGNLVCAREDRGKFTFKSFRNAFLKIEANNDLVKKMLADTNTNFITKDNFVYIIGEEALHFASLFNKEVSRPLKAGIISPDEKEAQEILEIILNTLVGSPQYENEKLYFSIPAASIDVENDIFFHEFTFKSIFDNMGYNAEAINESLAIIYANLAQDNMSGIAISHGAGMTNLVLTLSAIPIVSFSLAKSGDYIDQMVAKACGITENKARLIKEKGVDLTQGKFDTREETAVVAYYKNLINLVIKSFKTEFEKNKSVESFDKPIKIVLAGGTSLPNGFNTLFEKELHKSGFPLNIESVVRANSPLEDIAKGCLLAAIANE